MNILFIDTYYKQDDNKLKNYMYNKLGFYINIFGRDKIKYLSLKKDKINKKILIFILKKIYKNQKVYVTFSRQAEKDKSIIEIINNSILDKTIVTEQNNLYKNDVKYIDKYIVEKKLNKRALKVLFVIEGIKEKKIKNKIEQFLKEYKIVDIFLTNSKNYSFLKEYIEKLNEEEGTTIEILDKMPKTDYNILLVFSKIHKEYYNNSSFILDYNNSDLDIESNTYLIYKKNEMYFKKIFSKLNMEISRYEKTKLGKLYIHASRLILDK